MNNSASPPACNCDPNLSNDHQHCADCDSVLNSQDPAGGRCKSCSDTTLPAPFKPERLELYDAAEGVTYLNIGTEVGPPHVASVFGVTKEQAQGYARLFVASPEMLDKGQQLYNSVQEYLLGTPDRDLPGSLVQAFDEFEAVWNAARGVESAS